MKRQILQEIAIATKSYNAAIDNNGQPIVRAFNSARLEDRTIDEMIGLCRGIAADGTVNQAEAVFLKRWIEANRDYTGNIFVEILYNRLREMLANQILDRDERVELLELLAKFTGDAAPGEIAKNLTSKLPIDDPQPKVQFQGKSFCFTGTFAYGPRKICQEAVLERGGIVKTGVSGILDYLVLGGFASSDWTHTSYGRKIEKALEFRELAGHIAIVSEDHWADHLFQ